MFDSLRSSGLAALALAVSLVPLASSARAQCVPDGLNNGNCCQPAQANLPAFPPVNLPSLGVCWNQCIASVQNQVSAQWTPPVQMVCGEYSSMLGIMGAAGPLMTGLMTLDYTRTWVELDPAGIDHQVWRFVIKVDLALATPGLAGNPCPVPHCLPGAGNQQTAFFYGYLDYSRPCNSTAGVFSNAIVLWHACDMLIHQPGLSDRPGVFHPGRSYAIVGPHTAVQPFLPMNFPAPAGPLIGEATRDVAPFGAAGVCAVEDKVTGGALQPFAKACFCQLTTFPPQFTASQLFGKTACVNPLGQSGNFTSQMINFPAIPWPHMLSTSMGTWTNPAVYPGVEIAWVNEGVFINYDECFNNTWVDIDYGSTTMRGWQVVNPTGIAPRNVFVDLADNYSAPLAGPYPFPVIGSVRPTDRLIYVNVP